MSWKDELRSLTPGWDGRGAAVPSEKVLSQVEAFLALNTFPTLPKVVPSPDGCIIIAWHTGNHVYLEAEFNGAEISWMLAVPDAPPATKKDYLHWVTK